MTTTSHTERNRAKVLKALDGIENRDGLLHLRPAMPPAVEPESREAAPVSSPETTTSGQEAVSVPSPAHEETAVSPAPVVIAPEPATPPAIVSNSAEAPIPWHRVGTEGDAADPVPGLEQTINTLTAENARLRALLDQKKIAVRYLAAALRYQHGAQQTLRLRALLTARKRGQSLFAMKHQATAAVCATQAAFPLPSAVMTCVDKIGAPDLTPRWDDKLTLAYLRAGWPRLNAEERDHAARLLDDLCKKEPHRRGTAWHALVRAVPGGVGLLPYQASPPLKSSEKSVSEAGGSK